MIQTRQKRIQNHIHKTKVLIILAVYLCATIVQSFLPAIQSNTLANTRYTNTNIVVILVDKDLYTDNTLQSDIDRYAQTYIQGRLSDTRAVIFPLDTETIKSWDITKMLENIYHDGIQGQPSTLRGVILIGDRIPLPIINDNNTFFPSIFPYTDFDDQKYYRDPQTTYFLPNSKPKAQAEIRHGLITMGTAVSGYHHFFDKLRQYATNPAGYIGSGIWYDDLIDQKESFNAQFMPYYLNNFILAEDIAYHRFNPLMIDFFNQSHSQNINNILQKQSSLTGGGGSYQAQVGSFFNGLLSTFQQSGSTVETDQTPTLFVDDGLQGFLKSYNDLSSVSSRARMRDNILAAGRWTLDDLDTHTEKMTINDRMYYSQIDDETITPLFVEVNKLLEDTLIKEVSQKHYALHLPMPTYGEVRYDKDYLDFLSGSVSGSKACDTDLPINESKKAKIYETFFYGKHADDVTGIDQTSIFIGSPTRYTDVDTINSVTGFSSYTSLGSSYTVFDQFVEANRGYNVNHAQDDSDIAGEINGGVRRLSCTGSAYNQGYRGNNTPLALTGGMNGALSLVNKDYRAVGTTHDSEGRQWLANRLHIDTGMIDTFPASLYDIAGSQLVTNYANRMDERSSLDIGGTILNTLRYRSALGQLLNFNDNDKIVLSPCSEDGRDYLPIGQRDFFGVFNAGVSIDNISLSSGYASAIHITGPNGTFNQNNENRCPIDTTGSAGNGFYVRQDINFKTIDSTIIHNSPNNNELSGLLVTTPSRPIDSIRYITFKGIGGDRVKFPFPNLYAIPVYQTGSDSGTLILKSPDQIKTSIINYLRDTIDNYNNNLTIQLNKRTIYFNTNPSAFTLLGQANSLATPTRTYSLIDPDLFINQIDPQLIDTMAHLLYTTNSILPEKIVTASIADDTTMIQRLSDINTKKKHILTEYLHAPDSEHNVFNYPGYNSGGYELVALTSDGDDTILSDENNNSLLQSIKQRRSQHMEELKTIEDMITNTTTQKDKCYSPYGEPVPIFDLSTNKFPRFDALKCRADQFNTGGKLTDYFWLDYKNAQGPVIIPNALRPLLKDAGTSIGSTPTTLRQEYVIPGGNGNNIINGNDTNSSLQKTIIESTHIEIKNPAYLLTTGTPPAIQPQLIIEGVSNIGDLTMTIASTGDTCLTIGSKNTCQDNRTWVVNKDTSLILPLSPTQNKAGESTLTITMCKDIQNNNTCAIQTYSVSIVAGEAKTIDIETPGDRLLIGTPLPFRLNAFDIFNNRIDLAIPGYTVTVSTGTIYGQTSYEVQRLDEILGYVGPSSANNGFKTIFRVSDRSGTILANKEISFVSGSIDYSPLSGTSTLSGIYDHLVYKLPASPTDRYSSLSSTPVSIIADSIPGVVLRLSDDQSNPINGVVSVTVDRGILSPGIIHHQTVTSGGTTILTHSFSQTDSVLIDDSGRINLVFLPSGKSGTETVTLTLPDGSKRSFTIDILPGPGTSLELSPSNNNNNILSLSLQDSRGNTVPTITVVRVNTFGSISFSGESQRTIILSGGSESLSITQSDRGGKGTIIAQGINNNITPTWRIIENKNSMIPWTGMNALYLSLIGSDWGKRSDEASMRNISQLFSTSPKLLAMTTQIADPHKLHPAIGKVNNSGEIISLLDNTPLSPLLYNKESIAYISGYAGGSTNSDKITLVIDTSQSYTAQSIPSIEESISPEKNVGRRNDQSHLTQFGQGLSVGDATRDNASDMLINIGDPLIMRISDNTPLLPSDPDGLGKGPGQEILSSPEKTIRKTLHADINNDGLEDIIIVYDDGSIDRQKQYGGTKTFVPMGPLLHIFDMIKDIFVADTAGDGFDDLIVQLQDGNIRTYTNHEGIFDVDGFPLCLSGTNDPSIPSSLQGFDQWFIDDMDQDGKSDIITNNKGEIQVIYGKQTGVGHSYISNDHKICDLSRTQRQAGQIKTLTTFTTQIASGMQIVDDSLIHREGLTDTSQGSIDTTNTSIDPSDQDDNTATQNEGSFFEDLKNTAIDFFHNIFSPKSNGDGVNLNLNAADPSAMINSASNDILRRSVSPIDYIPAYEAPGTQQDNLRYIATSHTQLSDHVRVFKQFTDLNGGTLKPNDTVKVTVTIAGTNNNRMTYIDHIDGPWKIQFDNDDRMKGWNNGTLNNDHQYVAVTPTDGYTFIVDNIALGSSDQVTFSYTLSYQGASVNKIKIEKINNDVYPDIKIYPGDSCSKFYWIYENEASFIRSYRSYTSRFIDLQSKLDTYAGSLQSNTQDFIGTIGNSIGDGISDLVNSHDSNATLQGAVHDVLAGIGAEQIDFETLLGSISQTLLQPQGSSVNIHTNLLGSFDQKVQDAMKQGLDGLCNGFDTKGGGLPVPFNMAFLSPGTFNLFGCRVPKQGQLIPDIYPKDKGFPAFWFPGDGQIFGLPGVPLPYGSILAGVDEFGYFGFPAKSGVIPGGTQIRVYISPTLTMQVGMAICFGPQKAGSSVPSPLKHMGGNCVVVKLPIDLFSGANATNTTNTLSDQDILDLSEFGACANPIVKPSDPNNPHQISGSPFQLINVQNGVINNPFPPGTYFGIVNMERSPITEEEQYTRDDGDFLRGGVKVTPKIVGGFAGSRGIAQCIVNDWLDRQVNYMINNLTNMQIGIYLPDVTDLGKGFDTLGAQLGTGDRKKDFHDVGQSFVTDNQNNDPDLTGGGRLARGINNSSAFLRKIAPNQSALNSLSDGLNNPFDQVAKLFQNTPLIQINNKDIQVKVPMIYEEDISRYTSYLQTWGERNKTIVKDRETIFQATFGICGKHVRLKQGTGVTLTNDINANQILDASFFDKIRKTIKDNQTELKTSIDEVEKCIDNPNDSCKEWELMDKDMRKVKRLINQQQELQDTCYSFLFTNTSISPNLNAFLSIQNNGQALITDVKENIKVLDQYKRFPLQLYQRVHLTDRYMAETIGTVDSFLGYISTWLNTNASRFEQYIDAILTMSSALETWQAIIDLSVNRQKKCSTCTVDNYDFYACSLGFLCPAIKPPLLKLPPLKIPSIYLDLSHIDARMEILLPKFRFTPTTINLPAIPDLPQPPQITITSNTNENIIDLSLKVAKEIKLIQTMADRMHISIPDTLPVIPIIPAPPTLPELPSFIPTLNLNLPYLPPAPKIPSLSPEFQTVLDVSSFIVDLFCIVKNNIGLVGESAVKTRIEQLTQRSYEIPLFDNINITRDASYQQDKLEGFDFKLDAYVNFTYNFSMIYDLIQSFADISNNTINKASNRGGESINNIFGSGSDLIRSGSDFIDNQTQQNFNLNTSNLFSINDTANTGIAVDAEKGNLHRVLSYLIESNNTPQGDKIGLENIAQRLDHQSHFTPQITAIQKIRGQSIDIINTQRKEIEKLADTVKDYDKLVAFIQQDDVMLVSDNSIETTFTTALFSGDTQRLEQTPSIVHNYIDVQLSLLDKYKQSLTSPDVVAADKNNSIKKITDDIAYLESGMNIIRHFSGASSLNDLIQKHENNQVSSTRQYRAAASSCQVQQEDDSPGTIDSQQGITDPQSNVNYYPSSSLSAQLGSSSTSNSALAAIDMMQSINYADYVQGLTLPFRSGTGEIYLDVVGSSYFGEINKGVSRYDINNDNTDDILLWSDTHAWIKWGKQNETNTISTTHFFSDLIVAPIWNTNSDRDDDADSLGYVNIGGLSLRLSSKDRSVKNIAVQGESYDSFSISWTNSLRQNPSISGYIVEVQTIPDLYHLKAYDDIPDTLQSRYVLLLPDGIETVGKIMVPDSLNAKDISTYLTGRIIDVAYYNPISATIHYSFEDIPRSWYYLRIASLTDKGSANTPLYTPSSVWSNHIVAGKQIIADDTGPEADVSLRRISTNTIDDKGLTLAGVLNTKYDIIIKRDDPSGIRDNRVENSSGQIIHIATGNLNTIKDIFTEQNTEYKYTIIARDFDNNITREKLTLTLHSPMITIDAIQNLGSGQRIIESSIDKTMDQGLIRFEKSINGGRQTFTPSQPSLSRPGVTLSPLTDLLSGYLLDLNQTMVTGGIYSASDNVSFYDIDGKTIGSVNRLDGHIQIEPSYSSRIQIQTSLTSNRPIINLIDTIKNIRLFSISPLHNNTVLQSNNGNFSLTRLPNNNYGQFNGGQCLLDLSTKQCIISSDIHGTWIVNHPYENTLTASYSYNTTTNKTLYTLSLPGQGTIATVTANTSLQ